MWPISSAMVCSAPLITCRVIGSSGSLDITAVALGCRVNVQGAVLADHRHVRGGQQCCGVRLQQDCWPNDLLTGLQSASVVTRRVDRAAIIKRRETAIEERAFDRLAPGLFDPAHFEGRDTLSSDDPKGDQFDFAVLEMVAVVQIMLLMKVRNDRANIGKRYRAIGHVGSQLKPLAVIAALRKSLESLAIRGDAVSL